MPTYRYECQSCGHALELFQSMSERPKRKCPGCGRPKLQRLIGAGAGVIFKGSGFYQTDYRSASYRAGEKTASGSSDKPAEKKDPTGTGPSETGSSKSGSGKSGSSPTGTGADKKD